MAPAAFGSIEVFTITTAQTSATLSQATTHAHGGTAGTTAPSTTAANAPFATVRYLVRLNSAPLTASQTSPSAGAVTGDSTPNLAATYLDSDPAGTDTGQVSFQVCGDSGCSTVVQSGSSVSGIAVGSSGSWNVPTALAGGTYYWRAQATDDEGEIGAWSATRSFTVDIAVPATVSVRDGSAADIDWSSSLTALSANWDAVTDDYSTLSRYDYCIATGTGCTGTVVRTWTSTGATPNVAATGLSMVNGTTYRVAVRAVDTLGNVSAVTTSDAVTLDATAPLAPTLVSPPDSASAGSWPALTATYLDPAPASAGQLTFQVCSDLACTAVAQSGTSAAALTTGTDGQWTPSAAAGSYYWRARGTDQAGTDGAWSTARAFTVGTSSLTLTVSSATLPLGQLTLGANSTGSVSVQVQTNSLGGYVLNASDTTGATGPACTGGGCGASAIADWTGTVATPSIWPSGTSGGAGMTVLDATGGRLSKWGTGTGTAPTDYVNNAFAGLSGTSALVHQRTTWAATTDTIQLGYRVNAPTSTLAGSYQTSLTVTATANP